MIHWTSPGQLRDHPRSTRAQGLERGRKLSGRRRHPASRSYELATRLARSGSLYSPRCAMREPDVAVSESRIQRVHHDQAFVIIGNDLARDPGLTFRARGVMLYLLSLPDDWRVSSQRMADESEIIEGKHAIRTALRELEAYGYVRRVTRQMEDGTFSTTVLVDEAGGLTDAHPLVVGLTCPNAVEPQVGPKTNEPTSAEWASKKGPSYKVPKEEVPRGRREHRCIHCHESVATCECENQELRMEWVA